VNNAGVQKLTDNLPSLMDELLATAPADQKVCLANQHTAIFDVEVTLSTSMAFVQNEYRFDNLGGWQSWNVTDHA